MSWFAFGAYGRPVEETIITGWTDDWEGNIEFLYSTRVAPLFNLRLYRVQLPRELKKKVLGPVPGGRWWAVGEVGNQDLPYGLPTLSIRLGTLMRAGVKIWLYEPYRKIWHLISGPLDPMIDVAWRSKKPWAAYVVGYRGGLALPARKVRST